MKKWWGVFKVLQYYEIACNCVRKITEWLFRKYSIHYDNISVKVQQYVIKLVSDLRQVGGFLRILHQ
jgi:hypothetical protein